MHGRTVGIINGVIPIAVDNGVVLVEPNVLRCPVDLVGIRMNGRFAVRRTNPDVGALNPPRPGFTVDVDESLVGFAGFMM